jgi:hypothetical protein
MPADEPARGAAYWIDRLDLEPHPEGGYFREVYRGDDTLSEAALPERFDGPRNTAALIHFLLPAGAFSALHRIRQDELWHFLAGDPVTLFALAPDGTRTDTTLGRDLDAGQQLQAAVPAGRWFGAALAGGPAEDTGDPAGEAKGEPFALVGCTTAPAFDFDDFEMADRAALAERFPEHRALVRRLTRAS